MGRWVKLLGPYWCRTVGVSCCDMLRHAATQGLPGQCTSMEVGTCGDQRQRLCEAFAVLKCKSMTATPPWCFTFQSISIVSFKYFNIFTICIYNGCFFTLPGTSNDELKQVLKTHRAATASRGLFVSGKRGQRTNQRFSCAAPKQNNPRKDAQIQSAQFSNQFIQELIAVRE